MDIEDDSNRVLELTAEIVAAYVSNNPLPAASVPEFITSINATLAGIASATSATSGPALVAELQKPAVNPKRSVFPDYIICLDDGKKFKSLKRHIVAIGMTPDEYRAKWKLPADYPMVAANYSATRSALAISMGLGRKATPAKPIKKARRSRAKTAA